MGGSVTCAELELDRKERVLHQFVRARQIRKQLDSTLNRILNANENNNESNINNKNKTSSGNRSELAREFLQDKKTADLMQELVSLTDAVRGGYTLSVNEYGTHAREQLESRVDTKQKVLDACENVIEQHLQECAKMWDKDDVVLGDTGSNHIPFNIGKTTRAVNSFMERNRKNTMNISSTVESNKAMSKGKMNTSTESSDLVSIIKNQGHTSKGLSSTETLYKSSNTSLSGQSFRKSNKNLKGLYEPPRHALGRSELIGKNLSAIVEKSIHSSNDNDADDDDTISSSFARSSKSALKSSAQEVTRSTSTKSVKKWVKRSTATSSSRVEANLTISAKKSSKKCHFCKRENNVWMRCTYYQPTGEKCRNYFCHGCLHEYFSDLPKMRIKEWHGPCCLGVCTCKSCTNKSKNKPERNESNRRKTRFS